MSRRRQGIMDTPTAFLLSIAVSLVLWILLLTLVKWVIYG